MEGTLHAIFKSVCIAHDLLEDDEEWARCFDDTALFSSGRSLQILFTTALLFGDITDPLALWKCFSASICDVLLYTLERNNTLRVAQALHDAEIDYGLYLISFFLAEAGQAIRDYELPNYTNNWGGSEGNGLIAAELDYDSIEENNGT